MQCVSCILLDRKYISVFLTVGYCTISFTILKYPLYNLFFWYIGRRFHLQILKAYNFKNLTTCNPSCPMSFFQILLLAVCLYTNLWSCSVFYSVLLQKSWWILFLYKLIKKVTSETIRLVLLYAWFFFML